MSSVQNYFKRFGSIDNVKIIQRKQKFAYGFVQFSSTTSAAHALLEPKHRIGRNTLRVQAADSWHQPSINAARPVTDACTSTVSMTKFPDLNEDCLLEIFGQLSIIDLCAIERTCVRFACVAQQIFAKRHQSFDFADCEKIGASRKPYTLHVARKILMSFGHQMHALKMSSQEFRAPNKRRFAELLPRYCDNLRTLHLHAFRFTSSAIGMLRNLFENIVDLTLDECEVEEMVELQNLMARCRYLKSLSLSSYGALCDLCIDVVYPRLESIVVSTLYTDAEELYQFFKNHPQLKRLHVKRWGYMGDVVFQKIGADLKQLQSLAIVINGFDNFVSNLNCLLQLDDLRELKLNCSLYSIAGFVAQLAAKDRIEVLHITDGVLNEQLIDAVVQCKRLTSLKLCSMPNVHNRFLEQLANGLPALQEFHLYRCQTVTIAGIVGFVRHAQQLQRLYLCKTTALIDDAAILQMVEVCRQRQRPLQIIGVRREGYVRNEHGVSPGVIASSAKFVQFLTLSYSDWGDVDDDDSSLDDESDFNDSDDDFGWAAYGSDDEYFMNHYQGGNEAWDILNMIHNQF